MLMERAMHSLSVSSQVSIIIMTLNFTICYLEAIMEGVGVFPQGPLPLPLPSFHLWMSPKQTLAHCSTFTSLG